MEASLFTLAVPQPGTLAAALSDGETERDAQLLVAGNYPEKQFSCTTQDLDDIVATFNKFDAAGDTEQVPIKVEHVSSPLDPLGYVRKVWRDGQALMGKIAFDPTVAPFLAKRAVKKLSVGLARLAENNTLALAEVSLVLNPHVKTAALLSETLTPRPPLPMLGEGGSDKDTEIARLRAQLSSQDAEARIVGLKQAGKLVPALEGPARVLLSAGDGAVITLSDGQTQSVADAAYALLSALPILVKFTETAAGKGKEEDDGQDALYGSATNPALSTAQEEFLTRRLGIDPAKVKATMAADAKTKGVQPHAH
jgi:hypothetical protein